MNRSDLASIFSDPKHKRGSGSAVLVAQAFLPLNVIGAQRALRMLRVLLDRYERVYVIAQDPKQFKSELLDFEYGADVFDHPRLLMLHARALLSGYGFVEHPTLIHRLVGGILMRLLCSTGLDWVPDLWRKLQSIAVEEHLKVIVATGSPFITFLPIVRWATCRSTPVILDYRDLWTRNPRAPYSRIARYFVNRAIERPINRVASALITVSDGCKITLSEDTPSIPLFVLYNSPDDSYLSYFRSIVENNVVSDRDDQKLQIVFTGQVYAECTFAPFLRVVNALPKEKRELIEIHYYGGNSSAVEEEFRHFGQSDRLFDHGNVSKIESIKAMLRADLLLSFVHTDRVSVSPAVAGLMTTKVYDYFLSGKPVFNIGPVDAEINKFARMIDYRLFHTFTADDIEGMQRWLVSFLTHGLPIKQVPLSVQLPNFGTVFHSIIDRVEKGP